jgi:hypothetical protein
MQRLPKIDLSDTDGHGEFALTDADAQSFSVYVVGFDIFAHVKAHCSLLGCQTYLGYLIAVSRYGKRANFQGPGQRSNAKMMFIVYKCF